MDDKRGLWHGKDADSGEWIEGYYAGYYPRYSNDLIEPAPHILRADNGDLEEVIPETLGECAGIPDKKNNVIFEGDILRADGYYTSGGIGIVRFGEYCATIGGESYHIGFYIEWLGKEAGILRNDLGYWSKCATIVGNIHDNLELLSGTGADIGNSVQDTLAPAT